MAGAALHSDAACPSPLLPPSCRPACLAAAAGVADVKYLSQEQERESKHFKDPATNLDLEVTDKVCGGAGAGGRGGMKWG